MHAIELRIRLIKRLSHGGRAAYLHRKTPNVLSSRHSVDFYHTNRYRHRVLYVIPYLITKFTDFSQIGLVNFNGLTLN